MTSYSDNRFVQLYQDAEQYIKEGDVLFAAVILKELVLAGEQLHKLNPDPEIQKMVDLLRQKIQEL